MTETEFAPDERINIAERQIVGTTEGLRRHARDMLTLQKAFDRVAKSIAKGEGHNVTNKQLSDLDGVKNSLELMAAVQYNIERYSNALGDLKAAKKEKQKAFKAKYTRKG